MLHIDAIQSRVCIQGTLTISIRLYIPLWYQKQTSSDLTVLQYSEWVHVNMRSTGLFYTQISWLVISSRRSSRRDRPLWARVQGPWLGLPEGNRNTEHYIRPDTTKVQPNDGKRWDIYICLSACIKKNKKHTAYSPPALSKRINKSYSNFSSSSSVWANVWKTCVLW